MDHFYYRSAKTIHSKWTRHEAFRSEILSNKERLEKVTETGNALLQSKPEMAEMIGPKISELGTEFVSLEQKTEEKGERLFDSKRADIHSQVNFRFRFLSGSDFLLTLLQITKCFGSFFWTLSFWYFDCSIKLWNWKPYKLLPPPPSSLNPIAMP